MDSWDRKLNSSHSWRPKMTQATLTVGYFWNYIEILIPGFHSMFSLTFKIHRTKILCQQMWQHLCGLFLRPFLWCVITDTTLKNTKYPVLSQYCVNLWEVFSVLSFPVVSSFRALPSFGVWRGWGNQWWGVFFGNQTVCFLVSSFQQGKGYMWEQAKTKNVHLTATSLDTLC